MAWYKRLGNLFNSDRIPVEIDRELSFHLEEWVDELMQSGIGRLSAEASVGATLRVRPVSSGYRLGTGHDCSLGS
jgi:hypothetical protein